MPANDNWSIGERNLMQALDNLCYFIDHDVDDEIPTSLLTLILLTKEQGRSADYLISLLDERRINGPNLSRWVTEQFVRSTVAKANLQEQQ